MKFLIKNIAIPFYLENEYDKRNPVHPIANAQAGARLPDVPLPPHRSNQNSYRLIKKKQKLV